MSLSELKERNIVKLVLLKFKIIFKISIKWMILKEELNKKGSIT